MSRKKGQSNNKLEGSAPQDMTAEVETSKDAVASEEVTVEEPIQVEATGEVVESKPVVIVQHVLPVEAVSPVNPLIGAKQVKKEVLDKRFEKVQKVEIVNIPEPLGAEEVIEADHNESNAESKADQLSILETPVIEKEASMPSATTSEGKNEGDGKGLKKDTPVESEIPQKPVEKPPEKGEDTVSVEIAGKSISATSAINEAILREDSAFTVSQTRKGSFGSMGVAFKKYKSWMLWGGVAAVGVVCLGGLAFSALTSNSNKEQGNKETAQTSQVKPLSIWSDGYAYGYQQNRGRPAAWWIASITPVDNNHFNITWNGDRETGSGKGTGLGSGQGVIHPDGHVEIDIAENVLNSGGFSFSLGGQQTPTQLLQLKGKYVQQGSLSYFIGHDIRRGNRFDPETTWVLMRKLPPGWKKPETAP
jgi:hypothetical protein